MSRPIFRDAAIGISLATYCALGMLWIYARLAEVLLMKEGIAQEFMLGVLSNVVVALLGFVIAVWKGEKLLEYFSEQRRLRAWRRTGRLCSIRIHLALMQNMVSILADSQPPPAGHEGVVPAGLGFGMPLSPAADPRQTFETVYAGWADRFRLIRQKGGSLATPPQWEILELEEVSAVSRIPRWKPIMRTLAKRLESTAGVFQNALPVELHQALLEVVVQIELFNEQCADLADAPPHSEPPINMARAIDVFDALSVLGERYRRWFYGYLAQAPTELLPFESAKIRLIRGSKAPPTPTN